MTKDPI
jgi:hypothetical protein